MKVTENCVICGTYDTIQMGGHVHSNGNTIIARTCEEHCDIETHGKKGCKGCYGDKRSFVKISNEPFGEVGYIES